MEAKFGDKRIIIESKYNLSGLFGLRFEGWLPSLLSRNLEFVQRIPSCKRILIKVNFPYWITPPGSLTHRESLIELYSFLKLRYRLPIFIVESRYGWVPTKVEFEYGIPFERVQDLFFSPAYSVPGRSIDDKKISLHIAELVKDKSNFIITLGPPKTHEYVLYTGAVKTCMGFLTEKRRNMHGTNDVAIFKEAKKDPFLWSKMVECLHENLVILQKEVNPDLSILDGTSCMEGNGPVFGTEVHWPVLGISNDHVALDYAMCKLMGMNPDWIYYIWFGMREREEFKVEILRSFKLLSSWAQQIHKPLFRLFRVHQDYDQGMEVSIRMISKAESHLRM